MNSPLPQIVCNSNCERVAYAGKRTPSIADFASLHARKAGISHCLFFPYLHNPNSVFIKESIRCQN